MTEKKNFWSDPDAQLQDRITQAVRQVREKGLIPMLTGDEETDKMLDDCIKTMSSKGKEYTIGSTDRLHNFRTVGEQVEQPMEKVWFTYFYKHYSAVVSYIKNGCKVQSNETIQSRIMDCIVYLILFNKMSLEVERVRNEKALVANQAGGMEGIVQLAAKTFNEIPAQVDRCEDCLTNDGPFFDTSDHHGGTKHVCCDRTACHQRGG